jgi:hypothetical protein
MHESECVMPSTLSVAAFVCGAIFLLIAVVGGPLKLFGAETLGRPSLAERLLAAVVGGVFIIGALGIFALEQSNTKLRNSPLTVPTAIPTAKPLKEDGGAGNPFEP